MGFLTSRVGSDGSENIHEWMQKHVYLTSSFAEKVQSFRPATRQILATTLRVSADTVSNGMA
jgi:hypothetical protein